MPEIKDMIDEVKGLVTELRKTNDKALEAKADAKSVADLQTKIETLNKAIDTKQEAIDREITALKRTRVGGSEHKMGDSGEKVLRKAFRDWAAKGDPNVPLGHVLNDVLRKDDALRNEYLEEHPEVKALAVNDDTQGGFLVHADMSGRIIRRIFETSPIRQYASVATISTDALEGMKDNDEASAGWVAEGGARTESSNPKLGMWRIPAHELYAMPRATQKILDDAAIDIEMWLSGKIADKMARVENAAFVNGDGNGKPWGFLAETTISDGALGASSITNDAAYLRDSKIGYIPTGKSAGFPDAPAAASDPAVMNPLIAAVYAMKSQYRDTAGCAWAMHRTTVGLTRTLRDNFGRYMWEPSAGAGQPQMLFGYPIAEFNDMPVVAANSYSIAFANWREAYQIVDRIGLRILRDPFTSKGSVLFYTTRRTGGKTLNYEAIKLVKFGAS